MAGVYSNKNADNITCDDKYCNMTCTFLPDLLENPVIDLNKTIEGQTLIAVIYIIIGIVGFILNIIVLSILKKKSISNSNLLSSLLMNLALADLLSALAVTLLGIKTGAIILITEHINLTNAPYHSKLYNYSLQISYSTNIICKFTYAFFFLTNFVSTLTLTCMGIERYHTLVVQKFRMKGKTKIQKIIGLLISIWFLSITGAITLSWIVEITPRVYNRCFFANHHPCGYCYFNTISTILTTSIFGLIPACVMLYCYIHLARFLLKYRIERRQSFVNSEFKIVGGLSHRVREKEVAYLSITVTVMFVMTVTPFIVYLFSIFITQCNGDEILHYLTLKGSSSWIFIEAAHVLFVLQPLINPICYSFCNRSFRRSLCSRCESSNANINRSSTKSTMVSSVKSQLKLSVTKGSNL